MLTLTEEQIVGIVAGATETLKLEAVRSAQQSVQRRVDYALSEQISAVVEQFCREEILPRLREQLNENRDAMVESIVRASLKIGQRLADRLTETALKNLSDGWKSEKIVGALLQR